MIIQLQAYVIGILLYGIVYSTKVRRLHYSNYTASNI